MSKKTIVLSAAAAIAALALSGPAFGAGQQGMTVVKDPVTGQLRGPTAEEAAQLNALAAQGKAVAAPGKNSRKAAAAGIAPETAPGTTTYYADGTVEMTVDPEMVSYSVMTKGADGKLVLQCVTGASAATKAMSTPATTDSKEHQHDAQ